MSKHNSRFGGQAYEIGGVKWRGVGFNRAVSSLGHTVTFVLGQPARDDFLRRSRQQRAAQTPKKTAVALTRREKLSLDNEIL